MQREGRVKRTAIKTKRELYYELAMKRCVMGEGLLRIALPLAEVVLERELPILPILPSSTRQRFIDGWRRYMRYSRCEA